MGTKNNLYWEQKTICITCDDYKLLHFEKELKKRGYNEYEVKPGVTKDTRTICIIVSEEFFKQEVDNIGRLCRKLEYSKPWKS